MKTLIVGIFTFASLSASAATMFAPSQERRVLEAVQAACNNTWCEGDFAYEFKKFHCEKRKCSLDFDIVTYSKYDDAGRPDPASAQRFDVTCDYAPVRRLTDVLNLKRNYIAAKYFQSLAKCIDEHARTIGVAKPDPGQQPDDPSPDKPFPLPVEAKQLPASPVEVETVIDLNP